MLSDLFEWMYQMTVGRIVLPEDNFTTIVRKIIATIFFVASLFGGGSPYYAYRAIHAKTDPVESAYYYSLVVLSASLAAFAFFMCLPVGFYVFCTKSTPDWILQYCIVCTFLVTVGWDISCTYFPVRSTSLGLAFVSIGSSLPLSKPIVFVIALYYILVEVRDAWEITQLRVTSPSYSGGPIEKFVTAFAGFFCLVMCSALMGGMLFEYTTLLSNAAKSVELAKSVASMLLLYDTDLVRDELEQFAEANNLKEKLAKLEAETAKGAAGSAGSDHAVDMAQQQQEDGGELNVNVALKKKQDSNLELLVIFKEMAKSLDLYRPHLPDYVLPRFGNDADDSGSLSNSNRIGGGGGSGFLKSNAGGSSPFGRGQRHNNNININNNTTNIHHYGSGNNSRTGWKSEEEMSEGGLSNSTEGEDESQCSSMNGPPSFMAGRRRSIGAGQLFPSSGTNPSTQVATLNQLQIGNNSRANPAGDTVSSAAGGTRARNHLVAQQGKALKQNIQGGMMNRQGMQFESIIVARVDFERFMTYLLDISGTNNNNNAGGGLSASNGAFSPPTPTTTSSAIDGDLLSPRINAVVARILDTAAAVDATVHTLFEDSLLISWNATRRTNQNEYKCCKFLVEMRNLVYQTANGGANNHNNNHNNTSTTPVAAAAAGGGGGSKNLGGNVQQPPLSNTSVTSTSGHFASSPSFTGRDPSGTDDRLSPSAKHRQVAGNDSFSPGTFQSAYSLISVAAVTGTGWCQIGGNDKRQTFTLSKFSSTEALRKLGEFARRHGFMVIDQQIQSRGRIEYNVQGCGAVVVPRPEHNIFWEKLQSKELQQSGFQFGGYLANVLKHRRSTIVGNGLITINNNNNNNNSNKNILTPTTQELSAKDFQQLHQRSPTLASQKQYQQQQQQQQQQLPPVSVLDPDNYIMGSPPPVERRNTYVFRKDGGWAHESENQDSGQMAVGGSAILGPITNANGGNPATTTKGPGSPHHEPTGIYEGMNGSESTSIQVELTSPEEQVLKHSFISRQAQDQQKESKQKEPQQQQSQQQQNNKNSSNNYSSNNHPNSQENSNNIIYQTSALNGSASVDNKSANNLHRPISPSHGSQIVGHNNILINGIVPSTLSTATPPAINLPYQNTGFCTNNIILSNTNNNNPNSNSTSNPTPNVYALQQQQFRAPVLNYADTYVVPCYELVGPKAAAEDDEWLYQVQDKDMLSGSLTDAVNFLAQGHVSKAELVMSRLRQDVPNCEDNCAAFRAIMMCMEDIRLRNETNPNGNSGVSGGK